MTAHREVVKIQQVIDVDLIIYLDVDFFDLVVPESPYVPPAIVVVAQCKFVSHTILYHFFELNVAAIDTHFKSLGVWRPQQILPDEILTVTLL